MIRLIFLLLTITFFDLFFVVFLNIGFGKALPLATITLFITAFICNLLSNLAFYKYVLLVFAVLAGVYIIYKLKKEKEFRKYLVLYFNPSFVFYVVLFFYLYFNSLNKALINIDDLSTWGPVIKGIVKTGQFYSYEQIISGYPPFILWTIALVCYILKGYTEQVALFAMGLLVVAFVIPVLDRFAFRKKDAVGIVLSYLTLIALTLTVSICETDQPVFLYNSLYLDWIMALSYAYSFYLIFTFQNSFTDYVSFAFVSTAFLFTKQLSLPLYLVLLFSLAVRLYMSGSLKLKRILPIFASMIVLYVGWNLLYARYAGENVITDSIEALGVAFKTFTSENNLNTIKEFFRALFTRSIVLHPIGFAYIPFNTLMFALSLLSIYIGSKKKEDYAQAILMYLGSYGYALVMIICYISMFNDGYSLPLFSRYMQTYTFAYLALVVMLYINLDISSMKRTALLVATCLLVEPQSISSINIFNHVSFYAKERELLETYVRDEYDGGNVMIVGQTQMGYKGAAYAIFKDYYLYSGVASLSFNKYGNFTFEDFVFYLPYFDYLLITDYDDYFADNYWYRLTDLPLYNSTLYRIIKTDEGIGFEYIYIWDD